MNLDQGITMQTVVGETVKPRAQGSSNLRHPDQGFILRTPRLDAIGVLAGKSAFLARCIGADVMFPLTPGLPSGKRADRVARSPHWAAKAAGVLLGSASRAKMWWRSLHVFAP